MEITAEQLRADPGRYIVYDIRSERERAYGTIPDSYGSTAEELLNTPPIDRSRPLVILCAHGIVSLDVAEALEARGYEAYSLRGGFSRGSVPICRKSRKRKYAHVWSRVCARSSAHRL